MNPEKLQEQLLQLARKRLLDHYLELDNRGNFVHPPQTDDELYEFVVAAYGIQIPRVVITEGHRSPFAFIADLFFERVGNALGFANRNGGKTYGIALLNHLDMIFKPNVEICSAGATRDQANKCYRYFRDSLSLDWFTDLNNRYKDITGRWFCNVEKDSQQSKTKFGNGALLEIITGNEKGFRGPHPHKSRVDEIDEIEWHVLQMGLSMAHSGDGGKPRGQNVFTSTRQYSQGTMQRLLDEAQEKGIAVYEWNIWEALQKCTRRCKKDPVYGDCPVQTYCNGKAHYCDGFYQINDFIEKVKLIDRDGFETEWENTKPAKHKLVYHMLGPRHVMTPEKLVRLCGVPCPEQLWHRVCGLDFGSSPGHPFVYLKFFQIPNIHAWLLFYEYVAEQRLIRDHAEVIKRSPYYFTGELCFADWDAQDRLELQSHGIRTRPAVKGPNSVNMGIDYICELLSGYPPEGRPMLYIWHECKFTLKEWGKEYSWPVRPDGQVDRSGNPEKKHDHTSDAARMALFSNKRSGGPKYKTRRINGL